MMTVMTAIRAYEANLAALQATKAMATKALEIGGQ
jgi:flagellar basal-body rod protein FlgC